MPTKKVRVREHERRKPYQEELTHIDMYIRVQNLPEHTADERNLRPRDLDEEVAQIESIEVELHGEKRFCEKCGKEFYADDMVRLPSGVWLCKDCNLKSLLGSEPVTKHLWTKGSKTEREFWLGPISGVQDRTQAEKSWDELSNDTKANLLESYSRAGAACLHEKLTYEQGGIEVCDRCGKRWHGRMGKRT